MLCKLSPHQQFEKGGVVVQDIGIECYNFKKNHFSANQIGVFKSLKLTSNSSKQANKSLPLQNKKTSSISGSVNGVEMQGDCVGKQYSPIQRKYVKFTLHRFKDLFDCKGMLTNCECCTHFYDPLRPIPILGNRVPILKLGKVKLLEQGHIVKLCKCTDDCFILRRSQQLNTMGQCN